MKGIQFFLMLAIAFLAIPNALQAQSEAIIKTEKEQTIKKVKQKQEKVNRELIKTQSNVKQLDLERIKKQKEEERIERKVKHEARKAKLNEQTKLRQKKHKAKKAKLDEETKLRKKKQLQLEEKRKKEHKEKGKS